MDERVTISFIFDDGETIDQSRHYCDVVSLTDAVAVTDPFIAVHYRAETMYCEGLVKLADVAAHIDEEMNLLRG